MIKNTLGQLRIAGILDGISLVVLLFIAMPLKYWMDIPMAVTIAGSIHGFYLCFVCACHFICPNSIKVEYYMVYVSFGSSIYSVR